MLLYFFHSHPRKLLPMAARPLVPHLALKLDHANLFCPALGLDVGNYLTTCKIWCSYSNLRAVIIGNKKNLIKDKILTRLCGQFFYVQDSTRLDQALFATGLNNGQHKNTNLGTNLHE